MHDVLLDLVTYVILVWVFIVYLGVDFVVLGCLVLRCLLWFDLVLDCFYVCLVFSFDDFVVVCMPPCLTFV